MSLLKQLATCVTCHAWNADRTKIAFCPNNTEIHIYAKTGSGFEKEAVLSEHDQVVTGLDWGSKQNRIVSCSQDRNAYVWNFEKGQWKPTLVILRISRAATCVKWSPLENKFAIGSGAKLVSVCYFDVDNDWWASKLISKKHKSTVLGLDWHPNNIFIATACADYKARICSTYIKNIDEKPAASPFGGNAAFGDVLAEYPCGNWVKAVAFSPSGNRLAFVSHDSAVHHVDISQGASAEQQTIKGAFLPFQALMFLTEDKFIAVGHDCAPYEFSVSGGSLQPGKRIEKKKEVVAAKPGVRDAFDTFKNKVETGQATNVTVLETIHQNCINAISAFAKSGPNVTSYATTGIDGALVQWMTV